MGRNISLACLWALLSPPDVPSSAYRGWSLPRRTVLYRCPVFPFPRGSNSYGRMHFPSISPQSRSNFSHLFIHPSATAAAARRSVGVAVCNAAASFCSLLLRYEVLGPHVPATGTSAPPSLTPTLTWHDQSSLSGCCCRKPRRDSARLRRGMQCR